MTESLSGDGSAESGVLAALSLGGGMRKGLERQVQSLEDDSSLLRASLTQLQEVCRSGEKDWRVQFGAVERRLEEAVSASSCAVMQVQEKASCMAKAVAEIETSNLRWRDHAKDDLYARLKVTYL